MPKEDLIELEGTVIEALPNATFQVRTDQSGAAGHPGSHLR